MLLATMIKEIMIELFIVKKSIYQRRYHFQSKIEEAIKKFNLNSDRDERYELYRNLMKINEKVVKKISKKFKSKRLIFFYN